MNHSKKFCEKVLGVLLSLPSLLLPLPYICLFATKGYPVVQLMEEKKKSRGKLSMEEYSTLLRP